jgi:hypothetical protein
MEQLQTFKKLRASHISRWTIVATSRPQSMAEHMYNVAIICQGLCSALGEDATRLTLAALEHDQYEILTGDIPTPTKRQMELHGFNADVLEGPMPMVGRLDGDELVLLKIADMIEALHFIDNYGVGHRAKVVKEEILGRLVDKVESLSEVYTGSQTGAPDGRLRWSDVIRDFFTELMEAEQGELD